MSQLSEQGQLCSHGIANLTVRRSSVPRHCLVTPALQAPCLARRHRLRYARTGLMPLGVMGSRGLGYLSRAVPQPHNVGSGKH